MEIFKEAVVGIQGVAGDFRAVEHETTGLYDCKI